MSVAAAAQTIMRREQSTFRWTLVFVLLLHVGAFCVLLGTVLSRDAVVPVAGGDAGEWGADGMGFMQPGGAPDVRSPAALPMAVRAPKESAPDLRAAMANSASAIQRLEAEIDPLPSSAADSIPPLQLAADQTPVILGLATSSDAGVPVSLHRGDMERELARRSQENDSAQPGGSGIAQATPAAGLAGWTVAQLSGPGEAGASGGPVGAPGAAGAPGVGDGTGKLGLAPVYPPESKRRGEEGTVLLSIEVLADGRVGAVEVVQSSGFSRLDREAVLSAQRGAPYQPAIVDDHPVRSIKPVNVVFRLDDSKR
jgi:protein TonB